MLVPEPFGDGKKVYALDLDGMTSRMEMGLVNGGQSMSTDAVVCYDFPAHFLSTKRNSKGALALGKLSVVFSQEYAQELDGLDTYKNLSAENVLEIADVVKVGRYKLPVKEIRTSIDAIFGEGVMWTGTRRTDTQNMNLATMWFNLPEVPKGADAWFKFRKN